MADIRHMIRRAASGLLPLLCAAIPASCSYDDEYIDDNGGKATVQIAVMAREEGDLNTRADAVIEGSEVGTTGEYMHNLCVLIVGQDGVLKKKLLPDAEFLANPAAAAANVKSWLSGEFTLEAGTYTVYAFANIDTYYGEGWGSLTGLGEGESLTAKNIDVESMVLNDPAGKLNFAEGYFIPMSAKETVTVTDATRGISIGLDRLVSKVRMTINGKAGSKVTALAFGGYADKVALFAGGELGGESYDSVKVVTQQLPEDPTIPENGGLKVEDFYVNCSPSGHAFNVSVTTDEYSGVTYEAETVLSELPRNSIYPLTLQLNDYGLELEATCTVAPIGTAPIPITPSIEEDTYNIKVPEGCEFTLTVNGVKVNGSTSATEVSSCLWAIPEGGIDGIEFYGSTTNAKTITGHVSAEAGKTYVLTAEVAWTGTDAGYNRIYTINMITAGLEEFLNQIIPGNSGTRTSGFSLEYMRHEMLNMFKK